LLGLAIAARLFMKYHKLLVAIDRSQQSQVVFNRALEMARHYGASLMLLYVLPVETPSMAPYANLYGEQLLNFSQVMHERLERETKDARQWLGDYCRVATEQGIATEWDCKVGDAGRWICDLASAWEADLIVIGRRGLRGFAEMFLGSVSNYVIHHSRCSVLVVQGTQI
jgi:nucleotide-binding universal stress UspA family protein